ncbi:MAG: glycosyltransferase family 2 protein [Cyanobacteria bacterium SBC]|nr:glycosyltransferase family 2 protein [Cyanobacteria bacterium SBC]
MVSLDRVLVVVPVLNEENTIASVVETLNAMGLKRVRVVDNGSTDNSVAVARAAGAQVLHEPVPGYGRACWRGIEDLIEGLESNVEWVLFCDGDGSDDLTELPMFFEWIDDRADLVLGNRRATSSGRQAMTAVQNFGNALATTLIAWGWGHRYRDLGPLRLIRRSSLEQLQMHDRGFGWTVEMQVKAVECGLRVVEIPVGYRRRQGGRSKISGTIAGSLQAGSVILSTLGGLFLRRLWYSFRSQPNLALSIVSAALVLIGCAAIAPNGDFRQAEAVVGFGWGIAVMSAGFFLSLALPHVKGLWFWGVAVLARFLLLPMYPGNDVWRYLWEGYIQNLGFSPYHFPPNAEVLIPYRTEWWELINRADTSAIYPPITQMGFRVLAAIEPSVLLFKLAFIAADLAVCWLLARRFGNRKALSYAWNPLILYAFAGGAHYDSWFILPLVVSWLLFDRETSRNTPRVRWVWSALSLGISIAVKWISLPILAFLMLSVRLRQSIAVVLLGITPFVLAAIPFCNLNSCPLIPVNSSFVVYHRTADFIPYWVGQIVPESLHRNWYFGIPLAFVVLGLLAASRQSKSTHKFLDFSESYLLGLLVFSPIIHAWYLTWIVPFSVASRNLGTHLVSVSVFVYFSILYAYALGNFYDAWNLSASERSLMWIPFVLGFFWTKLKPQTFKFLEKQK